MNNQKIGLYLDGKLVYSRETGLRSIVKEVVVKENGVELARKRTYTRRPEKV